MACPYCRGEFEREAGALCTTCLAVHHVECWRAHLRCASCGHAKGLLPSRGAPGPQPAAAPGLPLDVRARCDEEEATLLLGVRPEELAWLIAKGHLVPQQGPRGRSFERAAVLEVRGRLPRLRDLMNPARRRGFLARLFGV